MPLVDLMALAPETQQAVDQVTEGWQDGSSGPTPSISSDSTKIIAQKIHSMCYFEADLYLHVRKNGITLCRIKNRIAQI